jgi:hypothetical protein
MKMRSFSAFYGSATRLHGGEHGTQPHVMPSLKKQLLNSTTFPANRHRLLLYGKLESQDTLFLWALIAEHPP